MRRSSSSRSASQIENPSGRNTIHPRTGEWSASSARATISLYQAAKSTLRGVTFFSSCLSAMRLRRFSNGRHNPILLCEKALQWDRHNTGDLLPTYLRAAVAEIRVSDLLADFLPMFLEVG